MKKLIERYSGGILTAAVVLLFAVCSLSVWISADFRDDTAAEQSRTYLHQTLLKTNLRRLDAALTEENRMESINALVDNVHGKRWSVSNLPVHVSRSTLLNAILYLDAYAAEHL